MGENQSMQLLKSEAFRKSDSKWYKVLAQDQYDNMLRVEIDNEATDWFPYSVFSEIRYEIVELD